MKRFTIELNEKELYALWVIACWFKKPVTSSLKQKLSGMSDDRRKYSRLDSVIEDELIETGKWLAEYRARENKRPELLTEQK